MKYLSVAFMLVFFTHSENANAQFLVENDACASLENVPALRQSPDPISQVNLTGFETPQRNNEQLFCLGSENYYLTVPDKLSLASEPLRSIERDVWTSDWVHESLTEYYYNSDGLVSNVFISRWDTDANGYGLSTQTINEYDMQGRLITGIRLVYDESLGTFVNSRRTESEWLDADPPIQLTSRSFNWTGTDWVPTSTNFRTVENQLVTASLFQTYDQATDMFVNSAQAFAEYDDMGREISVTSELWDRDMSTWRTTSRSRTTYGDLLTRSTTEALQPDGTWSTTVSRTTTFNEQMQILVIADTTFLAELPQSYSTRTYAYDERGFLLEIATQLADPNIGIFQNIRRILYIRDEDGDLLEVVSQEYEDGAWVNARRTVYSYAPALVSNEDEQALGSVTLNIYPSPARNRVNLEITLDHPSALQVEVFDILGRRMSTLVETTATAGIQHIVWEPQDVPAGLYFVRFNIDDAVESRSVILMH